MSNATLPDFNGKFLQLAVAEENLKEAREKMRTARSDETAALNEIAELQKEIDEMFENMRLSAADETHWYNHHLKAVDPRVI